VQIRGGPAAVIGDEGLHRARLSHLQGTPCGEGGRNSVDPRARRPDKKVCGQTNGKGSLGMVFYDKNYIGVFLFLNKNKEETMKKPIISYRRRCSKIGTGLSHYIMVTPKKEEKK